MVTNKRGWIKIVEAIFGIMIMSGVLLTVYGEHTSSVKNADYIVQLERSTLQEISDSYQFREDILNETYFSVKDFVSVSLGPSYSFSLTVCNLSAATCNSCGDLSGKEVYSEEIVISSLANKYNPKIVRISAWSKGKSEREEISCGNLLLNGETCTAHTNCTSGYCGDSILGGKACSDMPVWYYDFDCDGWGNGLSKKQPTAPSVAAGSCVNTTLLKPNISKIDCNDSNVSLTDNCPAAIRWYFDADCDGFRNASITPALSVTKPYFSGCINSTLEVLGINESSHIDCDDNNKLYNLTCPGMFTYYFDNDCDFYGNGTFVTTYSKPSSSGCVNTTSEVPTINILDCEDNNPLIGGGDVTCMFKDSLRAYWAFDNDLTEEIADVSVNATFYNNTTMVPAKFVTDRHGNINSSVSFNGLNEWIDTNANINASEMKTISFFAKFNDLSAAQEIVAKSVSGSGIEVLLYGDQLSFYMMNGSAPSFVGISTSNLHTNSWYFITATFDFGGNMSLYVDGNLNATRIAPSSVTNLNSFVRLGSWNQSLPYSYGGKRYFNGSLDDVMIFYKTLNSSEVSKLYSSLV